MDSAYEVDVTLRPGYVTLTLDKNFIGIVAEVAKHVSHMLMALGYGVPGQGISPLNIVDIISEHMEKMFRGLNCGDEEQQIKNVNALQALGCQLLAINDVFCNKANPKYLRCDVFLYESSEEPMNGVVSA